MAVKKRGDRWHIDVTVTSPNGSKKRIRRKAPVNTKRAALMEEQRLIAEAMNASSISTPSEPEPPSEPERRYRDHAVEFLKLYAERKNKFSEIVTKESILRVHLVPAFGHLGLSEIDDLRIDQYAAAKTKAGLNPKTVNNTLTVLRKSLVVAKRWKRIETVPEIEWCKTEKPKFDFLDFEEAARLLQAADEEWRPMLLTAVRTGLRLGELRALRWEDVDLVTRRLVVNQGIARGVISSPKNGRTREVQLSPQLVEILGHHRHLRGEYVFCQPSGRILTKNGCKAPLKRACRLAGLRQVGWHMLRHSFASHLAMRGVPIKIIQELMGHATLEMTLRYSHLSPEVKDEAVALLDDPAESSSHKWVTKSRKPS